MNRFTTVKGVSDIRQIPRLGKIYLGVKKTNSQGKEYPVEVDYFVCPPEVQAVYGEQPKELDIVLPSENLGKVFPQAYRYWKKTTGLYCKGDGQTAVRMTEAKGQRRARVFVERECPGELCEDYQAKRCNLSANLMIGLPKVKLLGVYQIDTRSYHSIVGINSDLEYLGEALGSLSGLMDLRGNDIKTALVLKRKPKETHGSGITETHYILSIELNLSTTELLGMRGQINQPLLAATAPPSPPVQVTPKQVDVTPPEPIEENPLDSEQEIEAPIVCDDGLPEPDNTNDPAAQNHQRLDKEVHFTELVKGYFKGKPKGEQQFLKTWFKQKTLSNALEHGTDVQLKDATFQLEAMTKTNGDKSSQSEIPFKEP